MTTDLTILYRGPLSSCNYGCDYCPFAKHFESPDELQADKSALQRFTLWAEQSPHLRLSILFTPWGEALIRKWYQHAMAFLSRLPNVRKVAIQTNLSCPLDWVIAADKAKLGIWATFHPTETTRPRFLQKCREWAALGVPFSAGAVGMKEHQTEIEALRRELPPNIYFWINAYKRDPDYYSEELLQAYESVDPIFRINTHNHPSAGKPCRTGRSVISVDGDGTIRRCHFIKTPIGNIYDPDFLCVLRPSPCTNATCGCHIGYIHMPELKLYEVFGDGILERIPREFSGEPGILHRGIGVPPMIG